MNLTKTNLKNQLKGRNLIFDRVLKFSTDLIDNAFCRLTSHKMSLHYCDCYFLILKDVLLDRVIDTFRLNYDYKHLQMLESVLKEALVKIQEKKTEVNKEFFTTDVVLNPLLGETMEKLNNKLNSINNLNERPRFKQ